MALVLLPGGSDVSGKAVKVILPLAGEVLFQLQKFCVRKKYIFISAIRDVYKRQRCDSPDTFPPFISVEQ